MVHYFSWQNEPYRTLGGSLKHTLQFEFICGIVPAAKALVQLGAYKCAAIGGFNAQLLKYFAVLHPLSVWHDRQNILAQLVSYLSRETLGCAFDSEEVR
jgi:hypothetical protein